MHLPNPGIRRIADGGEAVDLVQSPADIVWLSSADSELAALAAARRGRPTGPSLRLANLSRLTHPDAIDAYIDRTLRRSRLVVVRLHGGPNYWPDGLVDLLALARGGGPMLAVLPGEDRWNADCERYSSVPAEDCRLLWRYCVEGGPDNADNALALLAHWLEGAALPPPPAAMPRAGFYLPGEGIVSLERVVEAARGRPAAALVFYRALLLGGSAAPIDSLVAALAERGLAALPIFVPSLRDSEAERVAGEAFSALPPSVVLNTTSFAASRGDGSGTILDRIGRPVLQVVLSTGEEGAWRDSARGLGPQDLAMNVVMPELDGRILSRAVSFKDAREPDPAIQYALAAYRPLPDRIAFTADLAAAWARLGGKLAAERRIAIVLSNYPTQDGRIGNGVGLDVPESAVRIFEAMEAEGYSLGGVPRTAPALMNLMLGDSTNDAAEPWRRGSERLSLREYRAFFDSIPAPARDAMLERWGEPESDPLVISAPSRAYGGGSGWGQPASSELSVCPDRSSPGEVARRTGAGEPAFRIAAHRFGNLVIGIQPSRGYDRDPTASLHDPDLVPPHGYLAFYAWLRKIFGADAVIHLGKHGNLEWLPGKAVGLSETCWPEIGLGPTPLVYPFIVNDPGEGTQAKRRGAAVIVDHLTPAMARGELHGPLARLESLMDELHFAAGTDPGRAAHLEAEILALASASGLDRDLRLAGADPESLRLLDAHLCDLKELQIRDGLHILGSSPQGGLRTSQLVAIARAPRSGGRPEDASLHRAIAEDLGLDFDPLDCDAAVEWTGPRPAVLAGIADAPWRTAGDAVERIEALAAHLVAGSPPHSAMAEGGVEGLPRTSAVLGWIARDLAPALDASGAREMRSLLDALGGRFVPPGPSGAPTRGRPEVLPTGRNFYSVDCRAVPTEAAWALGKRAAEALAHRYFDDHREWPRSIALSAWATSNMRTGGDDIAEVLALIGAEPVWENGTGRLTGFRVLPLAELGRPRIDVTLRISGMFRDAFPMQVDLLDSAFRAIAALDEPEAANPIAAAVRHARKALDAAGLPPDVAARQAGARVFGSKPGAYGAGLQVLIDEGVWQTRADFADVFLAWSAFAYGGGADGEGARELLVDRLKAADAVVHNQDNREHDILDSDDYYQFQGGLAATVETLKGGAVPLYHGDHSRPEKPVVRSLGEEVVRVVRGRAANPKWIAGVMRHGYKGAFEMAATVDYLFAFAATTDAVASHHFDLLYDAYLGDPKVQDFIAEANAPVLQEMAARFREAVDRGLWRPARNSAYDELTRLTMGERDEAAE